MAKNRVSQNGKPGAKQSLPDRITFDSKTTTRLFELCSKWQQAVIASKTAENMFRSAVAEAAAAHDIDLSDKSVPWQITMDSMVLERVKVATKAGSDELNHLDEEPDEGE